MTATLVGFLLSFFLSVILTYAVWFVATLMGWVDQPDRYRKRHPRPVPRLGGISIYLAFLLPIFLLHAVKPEHVFMERILDRSREVSGLLIGSLIALSLGLLDDFRPLRPATKFFFQICAALSAYVGGLAIHVISNPLGPPIELGIWSLPVTVFWFVACMNAVNLLDGLDGLAAGVCLFVSATLFLVSLNFLNVIGMVLMACLSGAILGFLLYNFYPAKIFLGDSGSMLLGFLIAGMSLIGTKRKAEAAIALTIPIIAMGLPILDTSLSIVRRWYKRLPISSPDRQHIHHVLLNMGYSHRRAVMVLYLVTVMFGCAALLVTLDRNEVTLMTLGTLFLITFVSIRVFGGLRLTDLFARLYTSQQERRTAGLLRWATDRAVQQMNDATTPAALWNICTEAFQELNLQSAEIEFAPGTLFPWSHLAWNRTPGSPCPQNREADDHWYARLILQHGDRQYGVLKVCQDLKQIPIVPEVPILLLLLRDALVAHLRRLSQSDVSANPSASAPPSAESRTSQNT